MKNLFVCIAALSLVACVEGQTKGSNPDIVVDPSSAESVFKAPQELPTGGNGGGPGSGGSVSLGDSAAVISDLNSSERNDLCQKTETALTNALGGQTFSDIFCEINAISVAASFAEEGGDFQETCTALSNQCTSENTDEETFDCPFNAECEATVGEFEACVNSVLPQFAQLQELTCANFDANSASELDEDVFGEETPECQAFNRKCETSEEPQPIPDPDVNNPPSSSNNENNRDLNNFSETNNGDFGE